MNKTRVFIAGSNGMVGSALVRKFQSDPSLELLTPTRSELDLLSQNAVHDYFQTHRPNQVYLAAAKAGGILANNSFPADFLLQNLTIQNNIIQSSYNIGVEKLLFLGSSCIYPRNAPQPMSEEVLLTGILEPTNEPYAIAKIAGIKLCESFNRQFGTDYRSVMPTNLYGPGDNFHPENSHVLPALLDRFHQARQNNLSHVVVWGSGEVFREFLYVDDLADACEFVMNLSSLEYQQVVKPQLSHINIGTGVDLRILDLCFKIKEIVGFKGEIVFDSSKPDGTKKKLLSVSKIESLGWKSKTPLDKGLELTYEWYITNLHRLRIH